MSDTYILDADHRPVAVDLMAWAAWNEGDRDARRVAFDTVGDVEISTVFLGIDHNLAGNGPPVLFETMTFASGPDGLNELQWRYHTWDEAEAGHARVLGHVRRILAGDEAVAGLTEDEGIDAR